ncbi:Retinoschisin [Exaiptasia diaphana]|nr:Retinoschisin [Exaiptasia diaphana]
MRDPKTGFGFINFVKLLNKTLSIPPFKVLKANKDKICLADCAADKKCISFNFAKAPDSTGLHRCDFLGSDRFNRTKNFQNSADYHHLTPKSGALGMSDFRIKKSQIGSSTHNSPETAPWNGRLNTEIEGKGWVAYNKLKGEYISIRFGNDTMITQVATQGRAAWDMYVTKYSLKYTTDNLQWVFYLNSYGGKKIFPGNNDMHTVVKHTLSAPFAAKAIRFVVEAFYNHPSMRVEVYGCA